MERSKQAGISHNSRDLLKICEKMGASWSAQVFRLSHYLGLVPSSLVLSEDLVHIFFNDLECRCRGEGDTGGVSGCVER